ncbi:hypothetical protein P879_09103 [Paragonimus westermani]|uniref:RRM domain-containing protein n=1 Tax=Paragonimus westermani TaxID=34504 RepID=A0A8T0D0H6_9TREM|nr:hypothetical protein P879_09103 [Paragonimus westermani]
MTSMLPPKLPPHTPSIHTPNMQTRISTSTSESNHNDHEQNLKFEDTTVTANLTEDSMMILSQSVDSLHTLATNGGADESEHQVRTVFVSGLPLDAKPRELYLLFRSFKGYQSSTLKPAGKNGKLTAPVGFVTFESREQAEEAMTKLQGVKFDPEGNQHMRLEFARTNTKVTKPKFNTSPGGFCGSNQTMNAAQAGFGQHSVPVTCPANLVAAGGLSGLVTGLQPSLFPHLANAGGTGPFDPSSAIFATPDAVAAAAAAAAHWNPLHGTQPIASAYENATYLASAAGLLQAGNFRTLIPGNFNLTMGTTSTTPSLQMVQAALAQANAAAALGASGSPVSAANCTGSLLSISPSQQHQQLSPVISVAGTVPISNSSPIGGGSRTSPITVSRAHTIPANSFGAAQHPTQAQMNSFMAQLHQQQTLATVHASHQPQAYHQSFGFAPTTTGFPPQMAAAAIGLLGGYNSLVKELTGSEVQLPSGLPAYHQNVNF